MNDSTDELRTILLRSYLFWSQTLKDASPASLDRQCWDKKDYPGYMSFHDGECSYCNGGKLLKTSNGDSPVTMKGIEIGTVYCLCASLNILGTRDRSKWESASDEWYWSFKKPTTPKLLHKTIYPVPVPDQTAYDKTSNVIRAFENFSINPTRWGLLIGGTGVGKSSLLQAMKRRMGGFAYYMSMADFRSIMMDWKRVNLREVESVLVSAPVLLVDDWGIGKETSFATDMLAAVLEKRYMHKRLSPVLMTSNVTGKELLETSDKITNRDRIISRFLDSNVSSLLISSQDDMRKATTKNKAGIRSEVIDD